MLGGLFLTCGPAGGLPGPMAPTLAAGPQEVTGTEDQGSLPAWAQRQKGHPRLRVRMWQFGKSLIPSACAPGPAFKPLLCISARSCRELIPEDIPKIPRPPQVLESTTKSKSLGMKLQQWIKSRAAVLSSGDEKYE